MTQLTNLIFKSVTAFKKAHKSLMQGLIKDAGHFRTGNVGVFSGSVDSHMAPSSKRVQQLMSDLFSYIIKLTILLYW